MTIELNHTIVHVRDKQETARRTTTGAVRRLVVAGLLGIS
jgi:hypothetical protein